MPEGYAPGPYQRHCFGISPESLLEDNTCDFCLKEWEDHTQRQLVRCSLANNPNINSIRSLFDSVSNSKKK